MVRNTKYQKKTDAIQQWSFCVRIPVLKKQKCTITNFLYLAPREFSLGIHGSSLPNEDDDESTLTLKPIGKSHPKSATESTSGPRNRPHYT